MHDIPSKARCCITTDLYMSPSIIVKFLQKFLMLDWLSTYASLHRILIQGKICFKTITFSLLQCRFILINHLQKAKTINNFHQGMQRRNAEKKCLECITVINNIALFSAYLPTLCCKPSPFIMLVACSPESLSSSAANSSHNR